MTAIYKREVKSFLTSMTGCVFIALLLAVAGIYFSAYHLQGLYTQFSYTLQGMLFIFLIAVPILSMRVLAEERKTRTDQLLLTSPVSVPGIVLGKYLALATIFLIPVCILMAYPLILTQFGTVSLAMAYTSLLGFLLLGCSFLSIGLFLSSVTESQVIAAVLTFVVLLICYLSQGIASFFPETASASFFTLLLMAAVLSLVLYYMTRHTILFFVIFAASEGILILMYLLDSSLYEGLIQNLFGVLDITAPFYEFASGLLDLSGIVYYLSVIFVFLFLTVQSIQKRRWS
ncbi:MAG TPA: ABC transporter permease [Candidatus Choladousia intestinigallinarum]|nr:ABC transporter permease [Candidatus Choladousia intestinigallinarum]